MPRDAVTRTARVGTVGINGLNTLIPWIAMFEGFQRTQTCDANPVEFLIEILPLVNEKISQCQTEKKIYIACNCIIFIYICNIYMYISYMYIYSACIYICT